MFGAIVCEKEKCNKTQKRTQETQENRNRSAECTFAFDLAHSNIEEKSVRVCV